MRNRCWSWKGSARPSPVSSPSRGWTWRVYPNEILGLVGENGAGKCTLMKIMIGLEKPDAGRIRLRGEQAELGARRRPSAAGSAWSSRKAA